MKNYRLRDLAFFAVLALVALCIAIALIPSKAQAGNSATLPGTAYRSVEVHEFNSKNGARCVILLAQNSVMRCDWKAQ